MPVTKSFKELVVKRAQNDEEFRLGLLNEAMESLLAGESDIAKILLRDFINATVGFIELSRGISINSKSLMRMLSDDGNPKLNNLLEIIKFLRDMEDINFKVSSVKRA